MLVERIVFMQGSNALEALEILDNKGRESAMTYLQQWHHPGDHDTSSELSAGSSDRTIRTSDNYVMTYNLRLGYIGLEYVLQD